MKMPLTVRSGAKIAVPPWFGRRFSGQPSVTCSQAVNAAARPALVRRKSSGASTADAHAGSQQPPALW